MNYLQVRLTPWAMERIVKNYLTRPHGDGTKQVRMSKVALRASLADMPDTEFHTIGNDFGVRGGQVVTVREAREQGITALEVRFNGDRDLAVVSTETGRVS